MIKLRNHMTAQLSCALSASIVSTSLFLRTCGGEAGHIADIYQLPA
jgi:hypothetical protein